MSSLYLYNFNNYYNRKYKVYDTLAEYGDVSFVETGTNFNFNPNDGVNTTIVLGRAGNPYNGNCDYAIYCEDNANITSRWFIIEQSRNRQGQYTVQLRRDVLADNPSWLQAPTFIEKCTLDKSSPFIFNQEDMSFNEIKTKQTPLYDKSGCPWIVGFYNSDQTMGIREMQKDIYYDVLVGQPIDDWIQAQTTKKYFNRADYLYLYKEGLGTKNGITIEGTVTHNNDDLGSGFSSNLWNNHPRPPEFQSQYFSHSAFDSRFKSSYNSTYDFDVNSILAYNGKIVKDSTSNYYKLTVNQTSGGRKFEYPAQLSNMSSLFDSLVQYTGLEFESGGTSGIVGTYLCRVQYITLSISAARVKTGTITFGISENSYELDDAPYKMFCMPLGEVNELIYPDWTTMGTVISNADLNLQIASLLSSEKFNQGTNPFTLLDCQIVPYSPLPQEFFTTDEHTGDVNLTFSKEDYAKMAHPIKEGDKVIGYMFSCPTASGSCMSYAPSMTEIDAHNQPTDTKVSNQTDKYRICAGNYTSAFDINIAKNDGLYPFSISFTYKPFDSYIRVQPHFDRMYGSNFKDSRGLICSGVSLAKVNDTFNQYRLNNKYYQQIFDRQIDNLEFNNRHQLLQQSISAGVGAIGAGVTTGLITGSVGAGIGAGAASVIAGAGDIAITKALQNEALDYTKDNFGYSLQTIKAQPNTLARTADYNADTQYVPFLEYYTCTNEEVVAFINKLIYNGMTAMFIGMPEDYVYKTYEYKDKEGNTYLDKGYFRGVPIRLEDISDDYHMAKTIAEELNKGVYMK